jgi:Ankyrin repeats (many copies)
MAGGAAPGGARAQVEPWHAAALGLMRQVVERMEANPPPTSEEVSVWFWNASRSGRLGVAQYLLERGADLNAIAPRSGDAPLDIARCGGQGMRFARVRSGPFPGGSCSLESGNGLMRPNPRGSLSQLPGDT